MLSSFNSTSQNNSVKETGRNKIMVRLRNAYANANDTMTLFSFLMQMSTHYVIVTTKVNMTDFRKIYHDNNCGDDNLMHAHLHLTRK